MYYFSANHNSRCYLIFFQPITLLGFILFVPFIQSPCKSLCEIVGSNSLQMFVYLFLLGFLRTLLPFWYAWVINCSIVLYFRYFRIFSIPWKNLCVHEHVKKPLHFWGFFVSCFFLFTTIAYIQGTYSFLFIFAPFIPFLLVVMQRANLIICEPLVQTRLGLLQKLTRNFKTL